jgi:exosortase K
MRLPIAIENSRALGQPVAHVDGREALLSRINESKVFIAQNFMFLLLAVVLAVGLKQHYSEASSEDLAWILRPTAALVEQISGIPFAEEAHMGFVNYSRRITIAPACAGVNFFIIAFSMAAFCGLSHIQVRRLKWLWLAGALVGAYSLTIFVNAVRILVSIYSYEADIHAGWLTPERLHRLEGVIIYFFFLCLFYRIITVVIQGPQRESSDAQSVRHDSLRWGLAALVPLSWYGLITLAIPLLNGAIAQDGARFAEHGGMVIAGCLAVLAILRLMRWRWKKPAPRSYRPTGSIAQSEIKQT